jgi:hypothetical protein
MTHLKKWYIPVTEENRAELQTWWRKQVLKSRWTSDPDARLREDAFLLSEHPTDSSYYWCGSEKGFTARYPSYQKITLEQFREITNPKPMKHPEKWYIPVTKENHAELNRWRLRKRTSKASKWDDKFVPGSFLVSEHPYDGTYFFSDFGNFLKCHYQEITLEQFREITNSQPMKHPEKWYIPVTEENRDELDRWRQSVATSHRSHQLRPKLDLLLSKHIIDGSYFFGSTVDVFRRNPIYKAYDDYQEITLEQFRQITNTQPMKHPEHWCIEATKENFSELKAWWEENADTDFHFQVGYTLMSEHPKDESKYYAGDIKNCIADYPQFVEISLEQFRQITNPTQTTMSKSIRISRELLNEYYNAATTPQKEYLTEHFKLDGTTTVEAIRGLHDMACGGWKPKIKKNHPNCFPEDSKYFDFSEHANKPGQRVVSADVCKSLGLKNDFIQIRNSDNQELDKRSFYLSPTYNWELVKDDNATVLIPTKKS